MNSIDFCKPFSEQLDCLTEDLLQVKYPSNFLLDLGWYPEYKPKGSFVIQIIENENWKNPKYKKYCVTQQELKKNIKEAVLFVSKLCSI